MLERLLPRQIDNRFRGHWLALVLLGLFTLLKLVMLLNSVFNARTVAMGADGIPLDAMDGPTAALVLRIFALLSVASLGLILLSGLALIRYRAMVPIVFVLWLADALARRGVAMMYATERADGATPIGFYINLGLLALLVFGLILSLGVRRAHAT